MSTRSLIWILATLAATAACADSDEAATEEFAVCTFDFTADVRTGPSAPTQIAGQLELSRPDGVNLIGRLSPADGGPAIPVTGQIPIGDADIALYFWLRDGRVIQGSGPLDRPLEECAGDMLGTLSGPGDGDSGDWAGVRPLPGETCIVTCGVFLPPDTQRCGNVCVASTGGPGAPGFDECITECQANPFQFPACGGSTSFFDPFTLAVFCNGLP